GSTITSNSATFGWSTGTGVLEYFLYVGTSQGSNSIYGQSQGTSLSRTVSSLPSSGTIWARIWSRFSDGSWQWHDRSYTMNVTSVSGNLALNRAVSATSVESAFYNPIYGVDGRTDTRWSSRI